MKQIVTTYSPKQVSALLGIPKDTVLTAIDREELPAIKYNARVYRVTATDCALWYATKGGRLKPTTPTTSQSH